MEFFHETQESKMKSRPGSKGSVSKVKAADWEFQVLQNLIEEPL